MMSRLRLFVVVAAVVIVGAAASPSFAGTRDEPCSLAAAALLGRDGTDTP